MGEKTTLYIDEDVKEQAKIKLIKENRINKDNKSLSALVTELLAEWLKES